MTTPTRHSATPLRVADRRLRPGRLLRRRAPAAHEDLDFEVDVFDRLPTPFGLVRAGVAPDHPKIKSVIRVYEKTAAREGFRFFGNVEVGRDVSAAELADRYHAVIYAYGAPTDRHLGIPGEDLPGSHAATEFVAWYNAHPDFADHEFDLSCERAVVIGNGNVATDVARMLAPEPGGARGHRHRRARDRRPRRERDQGDPGPRPPRPSRRRRSPTPSSASWAR